MSEIINKEMLQIKIMIAETVAKREALKIEMKEWYDRFPTEKFSRLKDLIMTDSVLSELDSHYKRLWDFNNTQTKIA
jgi:hypothetical protein